MSINYKIPVELAIPQMFSQIYDELRSIPFYKTETGYRFADYLLDSTETETETHRFLNPDRDPKAYRHLISETIETRIRSLLTQILGELSRLEISDQSLTAWLTFRKETDGIIVYHQLMEEFPEQLIQIYMDEDLLATLSGQNRFDWTSGDSDTENAASTEDEFIKNRPLFLNLSCGVIPIQDRQAAWEIRRSKKGLSGEVVLNHNNPFADISIKEQTFIYGSIMDQFESLGLATSHTLTKVQKDVDHSYMALQPGFKIKRSKSLGRDKQQTILFDDQLTTELTQNDNNIYVYIDGDIK